MSEPLEPGFARRSPNLELYRAEQMVLRYEVGYTFMHSHLLELRRDLSFFSDRLEQSYWLARAEFLLGSLQRSIQDRRSAIDHFDRAVYFAADAVGRREFSDGFRVLADSLGQLLTLRGIVYQLSQGLRARDAAIEALELDWDNLRAHISAGAWYLNAPEVAGGDVEYAADILEQVVTAANVNEVERFLACSFLARTSQELDERRKAQAYYFDAYEIYPRNPWLKEIARELRI